MLMVETAPMGWARPCDSCRVVPCLVYCEADTAYLCSGCDARVHTANRVASRHKRVWVCEVCERSPAVITCKADAAVLCAACDVDIHSANPLARRHHRVPISPVSSEDVAVGQRRIRGCDPLLVRRVDGEAEDEEEIYDCKEEMGSWLLMNPMIKNNNNSNGLLYGGEIDEYLDLGYYSSSVENQYQDQIYQQQKEQQEQEKREGKDGIVPARFLSRVTDLNPQIQFDEEENFQLGLEYGTPKSEFCYNTTDSIRHCVSLSSVDTSTVPDTSTIEIINGRSCSNGTAINLLSTIPNYQIQPQFSPVNREARVLRYREKRKMRKFEKTIRYASRKAYAEVRPRIKGRFAKRSEVEVEVDQMFLTAISTEGSYEYGIVPSF